MKISRRYRVSKVQVRPNNYAYGKGLHNLVPKDSCSVPGYVAVLHIKTKPKDLQQPCLHLHIQVMKIQHKAGQERSSQKRTTGSQEK